MRWRKRRSSAAKPIEPIELRIYETSPGPPLELTPLEYLHLGTINLDLGDRKETWRISLVHGDVTFVREPE